MSFDYILKFNFIFMTLGFEILHVQTALTCLATKTAAANGSTFLSRLFAVSTTKSVA